LAAPNTINTISEETLLHLADHGMVEGLLPRDGGRASGTLSGVDPGALAADIQAEGAKSFDESWSDLLKAIETKSRALAWRPSALPADASRRTERVNDDRECVLRVDSGSIWPVRHAVGKCPLFAHCCRPLRRLCVDADACRARRFDELLHLLGFLRRALAAESRIPSHPLGSPPVWRPHAVDTQLFAIKRSERPFGSSRGPDRTSCGNLSLPAWGDPRRHASVKGK